MCEKRRDYIYIYIYIYIHLSSSGLCSLPTALLPVHQRLHIQRPLCQAPEVCRRHHADRPHPGRWRVCLQWGLVQLSYQIWPQKTTEGSPDCWANHWYNPPQSPITVLIQSEQKGWQNHSGPLTSSTLPLWTVTIWSTLRSSEDQNDQTQERFLHSSNPSH